MALASCLAYTGLSWSRLKYTWRHYAFRILTALGPSVIAISALVWDCMPPDSAGWQQTGPRLEGRRVGFPPASGVHCHFLGTRQGLKNRCFGCCGIRSFRACTQGRPLDAAPHQLGIRVGFLYGVLHLAIQSVCIQTVFFFFSSYECGCMPRRSRLQILGRSWISR